MSLTDNGNAEAIPKDGYRMARNYVASNRLTASHFLMEKTLGFNLHPDITLPADKKDLKIADVGTGTGIWLVDLSSQLPASVQLDGFDISSEQYPYQGWLPPNVSLQKLDITCNQIPAHLEERYDIIQIRFFVMVVKDNDPMPILKNLYSMLKPGGHLQWVDLDHRKASIDAANSGLKQTGGEGYIKHLNGLQNFDWTSQLSAHFATTGFTSVSQTSYPPPPHLKNYFLDLFIAAADEVTWCGMGESEGVAMRMLLREAWEESKLGAVVVNVPQVWVGRKG